MNAEQLNSARLARWSQNGEARLTLETAAEWLGDIGFCPYLPMGAGGGAPAPSFLEAVVGRPASVPAAGERSRALQLLARLIDNSSAVPMKLGSSLSEQPDFVSSPEVLRFLYALRGDRNFKTGPLTVGNEKVTPLSLHCWQAIEQQGPMNIAALQPILGRDITEAAIVRALQELWTGMYIFPALSATGEPAQWELLFRRFPQPVAAGASTGHAEAQSAMISLYLQASVAAREDEILVFLSPLAPQSKLREVIRGLGSMRQLDILDIGGRAHVALQGGLLPEMVAQLSEEQLAGLSDIGDEAVIGNEAATAMEASIETETETETGIEIESAPQPPQRPWKSRPPGKISESQVFTPKKFVAKTFAARQERPGRPASAGFANRGTGENRGPGPRNFGPRSFAASAEGKRSPGGRGPKGYAAKERGPKERGPKERGPGERARRWEKSGDVPEAPSTGGRPFAPKASGFKPSGSKAGGFKAGGFKAGGFKSSGFKAGAPKFRGSKPFGSKPAGYEPSAGRPWQSKSSDSDTHDGPRRPWKKFSAAGDSRTDSKDAVRRPYAAKSSGFKPRTAKPWQRKAATETDAGEKTYRPKSSGFTRSGFKSAGSKAAEGRSSGAPPSGARPSGAKSFGAKSFGSKPFGARSSGAKTFGSRPSGGKSFGAKTSGARPASGKPWSSRGAGSRPSKGAESKGAESRVGSAKSYAARASGKPYSKAGDAKPWAKRSAASSAGEEGRPKRRSEAAERSEASPQEKGPKPFWAKNSRGGKGSSAASGTHRPRGKKTARKSGKKK